MLGKLLKYEIPAVGRRLVPLYIALAASSVLLGLALRTVNSSEGLFVGLSALAYVGLTVAIFVMAVLMIIMRYNNSLLGDEAYFNLVLPVTVTKHIANKTISALIWTVLSALVSLISVFLVGMFGAGIKQILNFEWLDMLREIFQTATWQIVVIFIEIMIGGILSIVKSILAIYAAITIAHQARKHQALLGIGAYIILMIFEGTAGGILTRPLTVFMDSLSMSAGDWFARSQAMAGILLIVVLVIGAVYFFICKYLMDRRLNLN